MTIGSEDRARRAGTSGRRSSRTTVGVVADKSLACWGLKTYLAQTPGLRVQFLEPDQLRRLERRACACPGVLVARFTDELAQDSVEALLRLASRCQLIAVVAEDHREHTSHLMAAGVHCFIDQGCAPRELLDLIVAAGQKAVTLAPGLARLLANGKSLSDGGTLSSGARLSPRENAVLRRIAAGRSNKEIASELKIGRRTVETYRASLMRKLDVHSTVSLVRYAMAHGLCDRDPPAIDSAKGHSDCAAGTVVSIPQPS